MQEPLSTGEQWIYDPLWEMTGWHDNGSHTQCYLTPHTGERAPS